MSSSSTSPKVLVIAPRFPVIHQPWIDTYLEQLLINKLPFGIYSANRGELGAYHAKVDRLGLRQYVVDFLLRKDLLWRSIFKLVFWRPWALIKALLLIRRRMPVFSRYGLSRLPVLLKMLYFYARKDAFEGVAIIHAHEEIAAFQFLHLAILFDLPIVVSFHGFPPPGVGQLSTAKRRMLYDCAARVIVNTLYSRGQVATLGCEAAKTVILPQGLPIGDFPFIPRSAPAAGETLTLLSVSRFHRDKGQGYSLLALRRLLDKGIDAHWHFIGVGEDLVRLRRICKRLRLESAVSFHEEMEQSALREFYQRCHLFVLASTDSGTHAETQGVVLQEAQASGCIPIASHVGGIPEVVHNYADAIMVRHKSSRAMAEAVIYLLAQPEEWERYQVAGRNNVLENFSADVIGRRMAELLRSVTAEHVAQPSQPAGVAHIGPT